MHSGMRAKIINNSNCSLCKKTVLRLTGKTAKLRSKLDASHWSTEVDGVFVTLPESCLYFGIDEKHIQRMKNV